MKAVLRSLQTSIEALHDIEIPLDVTAYTVDDDVLGTLPGAREGLPEQLLVHQNDDTLELALYVSPDILTALAEDDPHEQLHDGNLGHYCVALEGVSHFVFVAYRAQLGRPVTALELEIQAEVDKFVHGWLLLASQGMDFGEAAQALWRRFFQGFELHEQVRADESHRYRTASKAAGAYCRSLLQRYRRDDHAARLTRDVRGYYRMGLADKVRAAA